MPFRPLRAIRRFHAAAAATAACAVLALITPAAAQGGRLDAQFRVSIAGLPIGSGTWVIDFEPDRYSMNATGQVSGLLKAFSSGEGTATIRGTVAAGRLASTSYAMTIRTRNKTDDVRMGLTSSTVRELTVEPPVEPDDGNVPLTEAHKRGVLDPISAGVIPAVGLEGLEPEACRRTLSVFDGRQRYDLALSYKRTDKVKTERGYAGPVLVCAVAYTPLGGHDPDRAAVKALRDTRDIEMWFAPLAGTRFLGVYRIILPTMVGHAVLEATRYLSTSKPAAAARPAGSTQRTQ